MLKIALLADIQEEIQLNSLNSKSAFIYELASAMHQSSLDRGGISVDLIAKKNSKGDMPVITVDAEELGSVTDDPFTQYMYQDAVYLQLVLSGALDEYAIIHSLTPVVSPLILLALKGRAIVQTVTYHNSHPSVSLLGKFLGQNIRQVNIGQYAEKGLLSIPPCVDLSVFYPDKKPSDDFLFWIGKIGDPGEPEARFIADSLGVAFFSFENGLPSEMIRHARVVLHFPGNSSPCESIWLIRALACGTPFASWSGNSFEGLFKRPELAAFAKKGDVNLLIKRINELPCRRNSSQLRREFVLAMFGQRSFAARYREVYKSFF